MKNKDLDLLNRILKFLYKVPANKYGDNPKLSLELRQMILSMKGKKDESSDDMEDSDINFSTHWEDDDNNWKDINVFSHWLE